MLQKRTAPALFLALAAFLFLSGHTARAQDKQDKLKAYDTHGLGEDSRPYALTPEIELNMPHKEARRLIRLLPAEFSSAPLRNLVISALISRIDGSSITQRKDVAQGEDLLTVRLNRLNDMGAYKHAFRLYAALKTDIAHPQLLKAGVRAQLGLGRHSLACLEAKASLDSMASSAGDAGDAIDPNASFWVQMQKFCRPVIGQPLIKGEDRNKTADPDTLVQWDTTSDRPATWGDLARYSTPQTAAIMRNHAAHLAQLDGSPRDLSTPKLAMLTHIADAPPELKFELMTSAAGRNLVTPARWRKVLGTISTRLEKEATRRDALPESMTHLLRLSEQHRAKQRGESAAPADETLEIFAQLYDDVPFSAILAFESLLTPPSNKKPGQNAKNAVLSTLLQANRFLTPGEWGMADAPINDAAQATGQSNALTKQYQLLALFALRDQDFSDSVMTYMTACSRRSTCPLPEQNFLQTYALFLDAFDIDLAKSLSPDSIYNYEKGLTSRSRYVMSSHSLRKKIEETNVETELGKVIFLSTLALHNKGDKTLAPYLTARVLKRLSNAGINRFGRDFAITYLIDKIEKKGV